MYLKENAAAAETPGFSLSCRPRYQKRSDIIVQAIKQWIVSNRKKPGDRLPKEKELMALFQASKGVIRETLKSMEVQGLITISTGPNGGAVLRKVPEETAMGLLANYFFYQQFEVREIYEMSKVLEPTLSASVVGHLTRAHFDALNAIIHTCSHPARTQEESQEQFMAEVKFHELLADACPNPFLSFFSKFMKTVIRDLIVFKLMGIDLASQNQFAASNLAYHRKLIDAYQRKDRKAAFDLMKDHVDEVIAWVLKNEAIVEKKFLHL